MAKMNASGLGAGAPMTPGQPQKKALGSPGEQMRLPYVPPAMNSAAQPLQMSGAPAMATMPAKRNMMGGPAGTR